MLSSLLAINLNKTSIVYPALLFGVIKIVQTFLNDYLSIYDQFDM